MKKPYTHSVCSLQLLERGSIVFSCSILKGVSASQILLSVGFLQRKEQLKNTHMPEN